MSNETSSARDPRLVFTPDRPMQDAQLFAGRIDELQRLVGLVTAPRGKQVALVGERGVGKTSLVKVAAAACSQSVPLVVRLNCSAETTFSELWLQAFKKITYTQPRRAVGFDPQHIEYPTSLASNCPPNPGPGDIVALLAGVKLRCTFVFDEFDRLARGETTRRFADLIKGITDEDVPVSLLLVGVADNVTDLFDMHTSVERSLSTIVLPRMRSEEIAKIPVLGGQRLGIEFAGDAIQYITYFARGFPHVAHLLSLHAANKVLKEKRSLVERDDVFDALTTATEEADPALTDRYQEAVHSAQKNAQFRHVLAACAMVPKDEQGYFRPADLIHPLDIVLGRRPRVSDFTDKLSELCDGRGFSLTRRGAARKFRFRFSNPMMESYVMIRSIADRLITIEDLRRGYSGDDENDNAAETENDT